MVPASPQFGGPWTARKLGCVEDYLSAWAKALSKQRQWRKRYIDAFSGSGSFALRGAASTEMGFDLGDVSEQVAFLDGSVRKALGITPPFDQFDLIERDRSRALELRLLEASYPQQLIHVHEADANEAILALCSTFDRRKERAVMFLDPFGCQVEWSTLAAVATTQAIDVWYLFPAGPINRMLRSRPEDIEPKWQACLTRCLGTDEWRAEFYRKSAGSDLFGDRVEETTRAAGPSAVEAFFLKRLRGLFAATADHCVRLTNSRNAHLYSLSFAIANPNAVTVAVRIANDTIAKWGSRG